MTEEPTVTPPVTADDVVGVVVEKAAQKVADAANASSSNGHAGLSRAESYAVVVALLILNFAAIWLGISNNRLLNDHGQDFKILCQVIVDLTPADNPGSASIRQLAECFN